MPSSLSTLKSFLNKSFLNSFFNKLIQFQKYYTLIRIPHQSDFDHLCTSILNLYL